jgi:membrane-associated phospholipid phosphatase
MYPSGGRRLWTFGLIVLAAFSLGILSGAAAGSFRLLPAPQTPSLSTWHTWVLTTPDQFRAAAPPMDEASLAQEVGQLEALASARDAGVLNQIAYWNSGPPSYRWNQIALEIMKAAPAPVGFRQMALVQAAVHDATLAAWESKLAHNRLRPSEFNLNLTTVIDVPLSPSYPSDYAATGAAVLEVLRWLYPDSGTRLEQLLDEATLSRLYAGVEYPSDVAAGLEIGRQVAALVIARAQADGSSTEWTGSVPTEPGLWTGENPAFPMAGSWQPWVMASGDQFRPAPPPAVDSVEHAAELDEVRGFERTPVSNATALFWEYAAGGRHIYAYWNQVASELILAADWADHPLEAARAYALTNIAGYDAMVGCWDAKYAYWAMRPFQADPDFKPLFTTPNHPGYPSAHSCMSSAAAGVLAHLFPAESGRVLALAQEAGDSRIWAGIHFRSDVEAGSSLGANVAQAVIATGG